MSEENGKVVSENIESVNENTDNQNVVYFVSFYHSRGFDNVELSIDGELIHINQVRDIEALVEKELSYRDVKVQFFVPLRLADDE